MRGSSIVARYSACLALTAGAALSQTACARPPVATVAKPLQNLSLPVVSPVRPLRVAHAGNFKSPESVLHDADQDVYFVSNTNGVDAAKDNNGFISRMKPDGTVEQMMWVMGGRSGITLHAPKGMALAGDTLWVSDIDAVRGFNRRTGQQIAVHDLASRGATFLNDVAAGPDGAVYITDMGVRWDTLGVPVPGAGRVFKLAAGTASIVSQDTMLGNPNGIVRDRDRMVVVSFATGRIMTMRPDGQLGLLTTGPIQLDGVVALSDGSLLISTPATGAVHRFSREANTNGSSNPGVKVIDGVPAPGDIGYDARRNRLLIPLRGANAVEVYQLSR